MKLNSALMLFGEVVLWVAYIRVCRHARVAYILSFRRYVGTYIWCIFDGVILTNKLKRTRKVYN